MKINKICKHIATLGPVGFLPAPGTMGSLVTLPMAYILQKCVPFFILQLFIIIIISLMSIFVINRALSQFEVRDPKQIIIDEVIGCLIAMIGLPWNITTIGLSFILFRFFDITKLGGIGYTEKISDCAFGITVDDIISGIFANIIVRLFIL